MHFEVESAKLKKDLKLTEDGQNTIEFFLSQNNNNNIPQILRKAHLISRNLYLAQESIRIISRKNLDLIIPRLPQLYFAQWKLLLNFILVTLIGQLNDIKSCNKKSISIRSLALHAQDQFTAINRKLTPDQRIPPSYFDYEFIFLRLTESLESSKNIVDRTSRTHMSIFQNKYYCHDDHSDPDFQMDYTLAYMFAPRASSLHNEVVHTNNKLESVIKKLSEIH